jgi:hypothetical protein
MSPHEILTAPVGFLANGEACHSTIISSQVLGRAIPHFASLILNL